MHWPHLEPALDMIRCRTYIPLSRAMYALGCAALAAAILLAIEFNSNEAQQGAVALAGSGDILNLEEPASVSQHLPLILERGQLQSDIKSPKPADTIPKLQLDRAALRLSLVQRSGKSATQPLTPLLKQLAELNVSSLAIRRATLDIEMEDGRTATLTDISADVKMLRRSFFNASGTASFRGQPLRFEASWMAPTETKSEVTKPAVQLKFAVRGSLLEAAFEGRLVTGDAPKLIGNTDFRARRLRALARWFGLAIPSSSDLRDASLVGPVDWSAGRLVFTQAAITMDGNRGEGALTIKTIGKRPSIEGTLGFETFDLEPHIAGALAPPADQTSNGLTERASLPAAIDADLRLSASKITARDLELGRGAATISIKNGRMIADLAELGIEGGQTAGQITLDVNGQHPRLGVKAKLTGIDPGRVFTSWLKRNPLLGRGDLTFDGAGNGDTLKEMLATLSGRGTFRLSEAGRLGLDLKALLYAAKNANHVGWGAAGKGGTPLEQLVARFALSNGALTIDSMQGKSGSSAISGTGKVDIQAQLMDLKVTIAPDRPNAISPATAGAVAPPVNAAVDPQAASEILVMRGPWADPAISILGRPFTTTAPAVKGTGMVEPNN